MNRYKSSQKWRKVVAGIYESSNSDYVARRYGNKWWLGRLYDGGEEHVSTFLTLADCQEYAERWRP